MNVLAIIVTFNGENWINKCLESLQRSTLPLSIIVIDNASTDNTVPIIKAKFLEVILIETGSNLGFGKANNIGLNLALSKNADYVFLLNQDAWVKEDSVERLVDVSNSNPQYGIISPMHFSGDNTGLEHKFIEYIQPFVCPGLVSDVIMKRVGLIYETTFVNAAAWLIPKKCLITVGGFDPLFSHYGEDVDYIQRAQYFGYKAGIVPSAKIWHDSKILSWPQVLKNRNRMITIYLSEIKNIQGSLRSNILIFIKRRFDDLTSHLLFRRFKAFSYQFSLTFQTLMKVKLVAKARKASRVEGAFLNIG